MIDLLLAVASLVVGWFTWNGTRGLLAGYAGTLQRARLKNLALSPARSPSKVGTVQSLVSVPGRLVPSLSRLLFFRQYLEILSSLIRRMNRPDLAPAQLFGAQVLGALAGALVFGILSESLELALIACLLGALLPVLWARDQALIRERRLLRELPAALESLALCSEAGLSLEQGMDQYVKSAGPGPLREEFTGILDQTKSGSARKAALSNASSKLQLVDFTLFATSLIQAEKFGTGVAKTLQQLSSTLRDKQSQRAEKAIQELPVKLLLPLILCIMPVTFLMIFGPVILQFLKP